MLSAPPPPAADIPSLSAPSFPSKAFFSEYISTAIFWRRRVRSHTSSASATCASEDVGHGVGTKNEASRLMRTAGTAGGMAAHHEAHAAAHRQTEQACPRSPRLLRAAQHPAKQRQVQVCARRGRLWELQARGLVELLWRQEQQEPEQARKRRGALSRKRAAERSGCVVSTFKHLSQSLCVGGAYG